MRSPDLSSQGAIVFGIFVGIVSTSLQSLGLTLQRKSHLLEDERPTQRPPYRRRRWQIGMILFITSNIFGSSVQIGTLPLVILSPLQASGLVFNSVCASVILGEPFTRYSLIGTFLVCLGAALIAVFGALREPAHSLDELLVLLYRKEFIIWMIGQVILLVVLLICAYLIANTRMSHFTTRSRMVRGFAYGTVSGILSAFSLLLAKAAVELLLRTIVDRKNQFQRWQSWIVLLGLIATALCQLYYLNRGLRLCSTSVLYPLVFCIYNIFAILNGVIYYKQADRLSGFSSGMITLGVVILLSGVFCLSWRLAEQTVQQTHETSSQLVAEEVDPSSPQSIAQPSVQSTISSSWRRQVNNTSQDPLPRRPSNKLNRYGAMLRRRITEAQAILEELRDESQSDFNDIPGDNDPPREDNTESTPLLQRNDHPYNENS